MARRDLAAVLQGNLASTASRGTLRRLAAGPRGLLVAGQVAVPDLDARRGGEPGRQHAALEGERGRALAAVAARVVDVERGAGGALDMLVLKSGEEELLIPFAKAYMVSLDLEARVLRMRLPAGLTAINAPMTEEERAAQRQMSQEDGRRDRDNDDAL